MVMNSTNAVEVKTQAVLAWFNGTAQANCGNSSKPGRNFFIIFILGDMCCPVTFYIRWLDGILTCFTGPDSNDLFQIGHKYFAISDLSGICRSYDGFDRFIDDVIGNSYFQLYFR